jgi:hypothetical protein
MRDSAAPRVTVCVDGELRRLFLGLRVRHAIGHWKARQVESGQAVVQDGEANVVDLDGALYDGERLTVTDSRSASGSDPASH